MEAKRIKSFYRGYNRVEKRRKRAWGKVNKRYDSKMADYNSKNEIFSDAMKAYNKEFQKRLAKKLGVNMPDSLLYMTDQELAAANIKIPVQQKLQILGFGTFNCDVIYRYQEPVQFKGNIIAENGEELKPKNIIILDKTQNGTFNTKWKNKFMYDAKNEVAILAPLENG
jgi:hypothetical protein